MARTSRPRLLTVIGAVAAAGALVGAVAGVGVLAGLVLATAGPLALGEVLASSATLYAAALGTGLGSLLAPLAGFTFMRHVPLTQLFTGTLAGTLAGGGAAAALPVRDGAALGVVLAGFFAGGSYVAWAAARPRGARGRRLNDRRHG